MQIIQHCYRVYAETREFEQAIDFYEALQGVRCERRIAINETNMHAAKVGAFLILAGDAEHLDPVRSVSAIFYVDNLHEFASWLPSHGAEIIHAPRRVTGGLNLTARHADGLVVEYFESQYKRRGAATSEDAGDPAAILR